jgi:hypothetical protein
VIIVNPSKPERTETVAFLSKIWNKPNFRKLVAP